MTKEAQTAGFCRSASKQSYRLCTTLWHRYMPVVYICYVCCTLQVNLLELHLQWYTARLLDAPEMAHAVDREPPITLFVMGANVWKSANAWPVPETEWRPCFLQVDGSLSWRPASAHNLSLTERSLRFLYDPHDPCASVGAQFQAKHTAGPRDRSAVVRTPLIRSRHLATHAKQPVIKRQFDGAGSWSHRCARV